jgi:23S rRNA (guanosine2251-2'-O)-methyltransferase
MFATVLHNLKSPENTGLIVRTHVAFGGDKLVMIGPDPWRFKKSTQAFSRRLEQITDIVHLKDDDSFFHWCSQEGFTPVAVEISENSRYLPSFAFPSRPAIIVGHEGIGLPADFLARCSAVVTIPQFGPVECLNVAISCCLAIYEFNRNRPVSRNIAGNAYIVMENEKL